MTEENVLMEKSESAGQTRAFGLFLLERYEEAVAVYDDLLTKEPDNDVFWLNRNICWLQYSSADASFLDKITKRLKDLPAQGYLCLADVLNLLDRKEEALVFADKALEKDSENIDAYVLKAHLLNELKHSDELYALMRSVFPRFKKDARILNLMAFYALLIGNLPQADYFVEKALKTNETATVQNESFYRVLILTKQYDRLLKYGEEALLFFGNDPGILSELIKASVSLGEYEKTDILFQKLSFCSDLSEDEYFQWEDALIQLQRYDDAFDLLMTMPRNSEKWLLYLQTLFDAIRQDGLEEENLELAKFLESQKDKTPEIQFICDVTLSNKKRTENIPLSLIRQMNDRNAESLMEISMGLSYNLPSLLEETFHSIQVPAGQSFHVLDLGCGTGAMASFLEKYSRPSGVLTGVDISPEALNFAAAQEKYSDVQNSDLVSFCQEKERAEQYDLIVCMDVLPCFSNLEPVFNAIKKALKPDGHFIFSVLAPKEPEQKILFDNGLFYHSAEYVRSCLKSLELELENQREGFLYKDEKMLCLVFAVQKKK